MKRKMALTQFRIDLLRAIRGNPDATYASLGLVVGKTRAQVGLAIRHMQEAGWLIRPEGRGGHSLTEKGNQLVDTEL